MLYLMNTKNEHGKKHLPLAYSQRNLTVYSPIIEGMARYLSTQYFNNKPANQRNGKRGIKRREMIRNPKTKIVTRVALQMNTLKVLQQLKKPPLLAEELV